MALGIIKTLNNWLNMWPQGVNPGAGTQDPNTIGDGLNDQWKKIDLAVMTQHNADGTHKSAVIDGANLKTTVADGSSIEQDSGTKKLKVKLLGIVTGMLADLAVTAAKIADATITGAKIAAATIAKSNMANNSVGTSQVEDLAITAAKISHDNNSKKFVILLKTPTAANTYGTFDGVSMSATVGVPMPRAGYVTKLGFMETNGTVSWVTASYGTSGNQFAIGDIITLYKATSGTPDIAVRINNVNTTLGGGTFTTTLLSVIEVEFD